MFCVAVKFYYITNLSNHNQSCKRQHVKIRQQTCICQSCQQLKISDRNSKHKNKFVSKRKTSFLKLFGVCLYLHFNGQIFVQHLKKDNIFVENKIAQDNECSIVSLSSIIMISNKIECGHTQEELLHHYSLSFVLQFNSPCIW